MGRVSKKANNNTAAAMAKLLAQAGEALILTHTSPDGDTLGSALALAWTLEARGTVVTCFNADEAPANLRFLPGLDRFVHKLPTAAPPLVVFADCADIRRVGAQLTPDFLVGRETLNIDHHISNDRYAAWNYVDTAAAATGEIMYALLRRLGPVQDARVALCLYTALVTDTGRFGFSNTTARSLRIAAALHPHIDVAELNEAVYERRPLAQVRLLERALSRLVFPAGGSVALVALSADDYAETGAELNMSESVINYMRGIQGVETAVLLKEAAPGVVKVSLRSGGTTDVNRVAGRFQGGGHQRASGCVCRGSLRTVAADILGALEEERSSGRDH
jgi:phosphoesterase RecJ-like protein